MLLAIVQRVLQLVHPLTGHIKVPRRQRVGKSKIEQQVYQYAPRVNVFLASCCKSTRCILSRSCSLLFLPPLEKFFPFFLILLKQNKNPVVIFSKRERERERKSYNRIGWYWSFGRKTLSPLFLYFYQLEFT